MIKIKEKFLVTGAAGYLASWIVDILLREGNHVHGTVRSLKDKEKIQHLLKLKEQYPTQLSLFECDLLKDGSYDQAMAGCEIVIHSASPYLFEKPKDPEQELIKPAINGTKNILNSVNRTDSVKRVVLTSSVVSLYNDACDINAERNHTVSEDDKNSNRDPSLNPYAYSKTLAEQAAWEMQRAQKRWDLISIHPGAIFGPSLSKRQDATSVGMIIQFLNGSFRTGVPKLWLGVVDVRDAALAHINAAFLERGNKRFIVVADSLRLLEIAALMNVGEVGIPNKLPKSEAPKALMWLIAPFIGMQRRYVARNVNHVLKFNNTLSRKELGIAYRSPAQTFNDHIKQIVSDGLLQAS
jgi:nucleoside-diphosphate-sugar epimerase